jgi:hypothetical protein
VESVERRRKKPEKSLEVGRRKCVECEMDVNGCQ